jgi:hypothetical protein
MKRIIAAVLVAAMAVQSAGCTTTYPVLPVAAAPAPVRVATLDAADRNPNQVVAAPVSVRPPDLASGDFLGGPAAGILAGVALIGVIGLLILAKGTSGSKSDGGGGGRGGPGGPTLGGGF